MWKEFKEFAMKGNVIDLAIGVVIGGAFGKIVTSLVNDFIMPLVSLVTGKVDFSNLFVALDGNTYQTLEEARAVGAATLNYGSFITAVVDFVIIAFALFIVVKQMNRLREIAAPAPVPGEPAPPTTKTCPFCQSEVHVKAVKCPHCTSDLQ
ncbi:MAG: large conductance mechanosensitive channel protein MscL [Bacillota bacterium]|jgi:large conductance mechanosensitive channel